MAAVGGVPLEDQRQRLVRHEHMEAGGQYPGSIVPAVTSLVSTVFTQ